MPVPSAIWTVDGFLLKTNNAKGLEFLTKGIEDADIPPDGDTLNIEYGNATLYSMKDVPTTFRQISEKIFDVSTARKSSVLFSTDMYQENSVKSLEISARESGEERIMAPNDTAYKRWSCHSGLKLLCKLCRTSPPPAMGARFTVFWACGPAGWLALLLTKAGDVETNSGPTTLNKQSGFVISAINKYMSESRYP